jgi:hypothetical protein
MLIRHLGASAMLNFSPQRCFLRCLLASIALPAALTAQVSLLSTPFSPVGMGPRSVAVGDLNGDGKADLIAVNSTDNTISVLLSNGDGTFRPAVTYTVGSQPNDVAIADFNGDGKPDLAVTSVNVKQISVLLGNGDGTFQPAVNYPTSDTTIDLVVADFNGDGKLDIAATDFSGGVSILLGNGDGTFQADRPFSTGNYPQALAVADFNRDGKPDLAVVNNNFSLTTFLGNGDGTFTQGASYNAPGTIAGIAVGDLNLDGKPDVVLAIPTGTQEAATVLLGNGDGTFAAPVNYGTASSAFGVVVADFNGDGKPDFAITDSVTNTVLLFNGRGDGTFQTSSLYAVGGDPEGIAIGDFNGDGKTDLATANYLSNDASTLLGNGDGTFRGAPAYAGNKGSTLLIVDLNHDSKLDVVWGSGVMLGNGDGTLQPAVSIVLTGPTNGPPVTADFNHDGSPDLAFPTSLNLATHDQAVSVVLGNGDGTFQPEMDFGTNFLGPQYLITSDFNGDGNPDLIVTGAGSNSLAIALGDGTGNFQFQFIPSGISGQITTDDFNRDGKPDFIVFDGVGPGMWAFLGNGDGTFQTPFLINAPSGHALTGLISADLNGDGIPDVVILNNALGGPLSVMLGNGDGTFANPVNYVVGDFPESVAVGDLNQDGHVDLVVALISGRVVVLLGNGDGTFQPAINFGSGLPPGFAGGGLVAVAVADLNGDGYPDVLVANSSGLGTLTILSNQGNSPLPVASTVGLSSSLNPAASSQTITLTANAASANGGSNVPTGTVTFFDGSTGLGTSTLGSGTASLTLSTLSVGNHNLTAVYSGDTHFLGNTSAVLVQVINANPFTVTASGTGSASISPGQKAQYQLVLASGTAQSQTVALSCSGAPPQSTCTVSPTSVTLGGTSTANVTVTVQTAGPSSSWIIPVSPSPARPKFPTGWQAFAFAMLASVLLVGTLRKHRLPALASSLGLLVLLAACGGNGSTSGGTQGTPPAAYTIVVTAQSTTGTQQVKLALTVNP